MNMHYFAIRPRTASAARTKPPDPPGRISRLGMHESCVQFSDDDRVGVQVDLEKLPAGTKFLRFVCSR